MGALALAAAATHIAFFARGGIRPLDERPRLRGLLVSGSPAGLHGCRGGVCDAGLPKQRIHVVESSPDHDGQLAPGMNVANVQRGQDSCRLGAWQPSGSAGAGRGLDIASRAIERYSRTVTSSHGARTLRRW